MKNKLTIKLIIIIVASISLIAAIMAPIYFYLQPKMYIKQETGYLAEFTKNFKAVVPFEKEALDEFDLNGETGNQPDVYSYTIMSENETDMLATFSLYDNAINKFDEEDENKFYYVYRNRCNASYDDQTKFAEAKNLTFSVYYLNDNDETDAKLLNIVEGTFTAKLNENGKVPTAEEVFKQEGLTKGYNRNYYQDSYNEFVKPKLIKTAIITFVVAGLITALFAVVWLINPEEVVKKQQSKKNRK